MRNNEKKKKKRLLRTELYICEIVALETATWLRALLEAAISGRSCFPFVAFW